MAFVNQPVEEPEKSLRDYASPRCEDIRVQESDSKLEATKYEIKSKIIEMVVANPFEGMVTENPYRHIRHFTTLCNTVRQEGVPDEWFKWSLFPYSLDGEAKTWYSFASFEVEGNWNKLTKKFCEKFFPISKVQHLRRQVITFTQGEEEGIDQAWNRFNELIEQGPSLGFSGDVLLHTFFFSLTPSCMQHVQMCAGGDLMEKTLTKAAQLLQKISKAAAMRRDWETRLAEEPEHNSRMKKCAEFSKEATPKVTKEEPIPEKLEQEHIKSRTTPSVDFAVSNETNKRSMSSAKPLREFEPMDWVPIDYEKVFNKRRNSMPLRYNLQIDLFNVLGIDFMGPFKNSHGYEHILVMVDYVFKWVEAMPCRKASTEESIAMIKNMIFPRFGAPRILISDGGTHFTEKNFKKCLSKLGIEQTNRQVETSNRQLKSILNKTI
jgi:hypothetical protein